MAEAEDEREIRAAFELASACDWRSHDPFDLLLSPFLSSLARRSEIGARVAVQLGRRTGSRLRRVLRVPRHEEPKALADFLRAAAIMSSRGRPWAEPMVEKLSTRLTQGDAQRAWGHGFPYVSRFVNAPAATPNAYTTICVIEALLDAGALRSERSVLDAAQQGCRFVLDSFGTFTSGGCQWQRYWTASDDKIVNVQAMAASVLARAGMVFGDPALTRRADAALDTTLAHQGSDGSWPYSADRRASFVDGFHTGFVLQALAEYLARRPEGGAAIRDGLRRGMEFFRSSLLGSDGLPLDFAHGKPTYDGQSVAQCVQTLVIAGDGERDRDRASFVWEEMRRRGRSPLDPGNDLVSLRWSVGPGVLAAANLSNLR